MIGKHDAREAYDDGIIDEVVWIRRKYNLADSTCMTKATILQQLVEMMETEKRNYEIERSVHRNIYKIPEKSTM